MTSFVTPTLGLPLISAGQANKSEIYNDAINKLDELFSTEPGTSLFQLDVNFHDFNPFTSSTDILLEDVIDLTSRETFYIGARSIISTPADEIDIPPEFTSYNIDAIPTSEGTIANPDSPIISGASVDIDNRSGLSQNFTLVNIRNNIRFQLFNGNDRFIGTIGRFSIRFTLYRVLF